MADKTEGSIVIDADPATVMAEIEDFEHYTEWSKEIKKADIVKRDAKKRGKLVEFVVDAGFAKAEYTLDYTWLPSNGGTTWVTTEAKGAIKSLVGEYLLEPQGDKTKVVYRMTMELAIPLPGFLKRQGEKKVVDVALKGLKKRVESRA
ncbi:MAG: SRPBCC family protein [Actinomycetota bacterium]|nr:SRPBCC family protein [Actinomycetota bacterium]